MSRAWAGLGLGLTLGLWACTPARAVLRVEDDAYVLGRAHEPEAYALMLKGALAEQDGDGQAALSAYERAHQLAKDDPEPATRIYALRCTVTPKATFDEKRTRERWLGSALRAGYAPAFAELLRCLERHDGEPAERQEIAAELLRASRDPALATTAVEKSGQGAAQARLRLTAITLAHPEVTEAHLGLAALHERQGQWLAAASEYATAARQAPSARTRMLQKSEELFDRGEIFGSQMIAAAAIDAPSVAGAPLTTLPKRAVGLAVDEALAHGDTQRAQRRATQSRMSLGELAARAALWGQREWSLELAHTVLDAAGLTGGELDADAAAVLLVHEGELRLTKQKPSEAGRALLQRHLAHLAGD